jgi:uncharacterized protein (DUF305 family)
MALKLALSYLNTRFAAFGAAGMATLLLAAGCNDAPAAQPRAVTAPNVVQPGAPGEGVQTLSAEALAESQESQHGAADVDFMQAMIHHHAQALRMTSLVRDRSSSEDIPLLARRMELSQEGEIELMQQWLEVRGEPAPEVHVEHGEAHGAGAGAMPGMLTEGELRQLEDARGRAFDRLFLRFMLQHHRGALTMVQDLYAAGGGLESEADAFARHVEADQEIEIARMQGLLAGRG